MFKVHHIQRHGVGPFFYFAPLQELSNRLWREPNKDLMQTLHPQEVDQPNYEFWVHKNVGVSYARFMFRVHHFQMHGVVFFHYCYHPRKLAYQLTTLEVITLLMFPILGLTLGTP